MPTPWQDPWQIKCDWCPNADGCHFDECPNAIGYCMDDEGSWDLPDIGEIRDLLQQAEGLSLDVGRIEVSSNGGHLDDAYCFNLCPIDFLVGNCDGLSSETISWEGDAPGWGGSGAYLFIAPSKRADVERRLGSIRKALSAAVEAAEQAEAED